MSHGDALADDAALLQQIAGGDALALLALYDRYVATLLALAQHILHHGPEAEELIHEVFLNVWRRAGRYQPSLGTVRAWLIMHTRHMALALPAAHPELAAQQESSHFAPPLQSTHTSPSDDPLTRQRAHARRAWAAIDASLRDVLQAAYFEVSQKNHLAKRLGIRPSQVATQLKRAQHALHTALSSGARGV